MTGNIMSTFTKKILFTTKSFLLYNFMVVENEQKAFIRVIITSLSNKAAKKKLGSYYWIRIDIEILFIILFHYLIFLSQSFI